MNPRSGHQFYFLDLARITQAPAQDVGDNRRRKVAEELRWSLRKPGKLAKTGDSEKRRKYLPGRKVPDGLARPTFIV
jgi:hypothetical protein